MLYLLDQNVKTVKWNGIPLHEASSAIVKEEINGDFTLTVRYPITDTGIYQLIKEDMLIKAPSPVLGPQLFRIKKPVENDDSLDITAYHISDDVMQRSIRPVSVVGQGCAMALSQMVQNAKTDLETFSFTSDIMDSRTFNTTETETLYSVLLDGKHSIVGTWEGELVRDNFSLTIKRSRGADRGVVITTHKNLKSYQRTKDSQGVVTRIYARSTFKEEGAEEETTITVTVDSPLIGNYPYINEKDYENNNAKTVDELRKWAEAKFKNEGIDKISDAIEIEAYELDGQVVHLGDTVNIKSRKHSVDIYKKAIAYEYNALTEEYISITFDDKPGVGGSGVSSGVSNAADVILSANRNTQEVAIERAIRNANQAFDAEFEKRVEEINDGIEQSKAEAELYADNIKQSIDAEIDAVEQSMQAQSEEHDRQVADILSKTQSVEDLANQAKTDAASAITQALQSKNEAIADARAQISTVSQALNTAKSELQTAIASADQKASDSQASATALRNDLNLQASKILVQAQAQTALTSRVSTVETLADDTKTTVAELSKTVNKATRDIASVTSRTKTVEDTLSQTRTQYEALTQTVNTQTGQIDSINRKTADLQSGIDGVTERFDSLQVGATNYIRDFSFAKNHNFSNNQSSWRFERIEDGTARSGYHIKATCTQSGGGGFHRVLRDLRGAEWQGRTMTYSVDIKASKTVRMRLGVEAFNKGYKAFDVTTDWQRFISTDTVNFKTYYSYPFYADTTTWAVGDVVYLRDPQLEDGNVATTPHAAEEDLRSEFATYVRTATENSAELSRQIQLADGKAVDAKSYAQQTATVIKTRLESLETYKDAEGTRASQYLSASRTETAKQLSAERAAIASNYVAKSTYDENVRGTTLKLNEIKSTADTAKQNLATYQNTVDRKLEELTSSTQTLDGKINTASAKVDTVAGQIRTEISEVEGKIPTDFDGLNLMTGTRDWSTKANPWHMGTGWVIEQNEHEGLKVHSTQRGWNGSHQNIFVKTGDVVTFSFFAKATQSLNNVKVSATWTDSSVYQAPVARIAESDDVITISDSWKRYSKTVHVTSDGSLQFRTEYGASTIPNGIKLYIAGLKLAKSSVDTGYSENPTDLMTEIASVKTTITNTARGVEQLSTSLSTTNNKVTTAETKISQLISDVSSKVSQTDYNTLTGRVDNNETAITQNAQEISKRLTKTQVDKAITDKGYQTKSDVDNNITGRGYITSSALQPYALATTVQTLVRETADSFSRTISETRALIPTSAGSVNYIRDFSFAKNHNFSNNQSSWRFERIEDGTARSGYHIKATCTQSGGGGFHRVLRDLRGAEWQGRTMTYSVDIKASKTVRMRLGAEAFNKGYKAFDVTTDWQRFISTDTVNFKTYYSYPFYADSITWAVGDVVYLRDPQLEDGNIATTAHAAPEDFATVTALHAVKDTVESHTRTIGAVGTTGSILDNVSRVTQTANGLVQEVSGSGGIKSQVSQLNNSWSVQNLNSSGDILSQANLSSAQFLLEAAKIRLKGKTLADEIQAIDGKFGTLFVADGTFAKLNATVIGSQAITADKLKVDQAFFDKLMANDAYLKQLFAKSAFITQVQAVTLSASKISGGILTATNKAMEVNLNAGQIMYYTDQAALKRVLNGYPTQFVKFATGTVTGKGNAGVTVIGSNRWNSESSNDGGFVGIRAWNGANVDSLDLVGDDIRLASSAFDSPDGWDVRTLDSGLRIAPHNRAAERNSRIEVGDVWIMKGDGTYSSLRDILNSFNGNFSKGPNADSYTYYPKGF
ncbi:TPA: phage tail spike protein [Streptococcus suis]